MASLIPDFPPDGVVTVNRVILKDGYTVDDLQERSHRSDTFQPLFRDVLALCENGNEEIAYEMLWSGKAYSPEEAKAARTAKEKYAA